MKYIYLTAILIIVIIKSNAQWKAIPGPFASSKFSGMDFSELIVCDEILYAIISNGVYISYNNGESWMYASGDIDAFKITCLGSNIYVTNGVGIFKSNDYGATYQSINGNLPDINHVSAILATDSVLLASVISYNPEFSDEVYFSFDNGDNWSMSEGLSLKFVKCFKVIGNKIYAGTIYGVYMSENNGRSWNNIGLSDKGVHYIDGNDSIIVAAGAGSDGSIYITEDRGDNWEEIKSSIITNNGFFSLAVTEKYIYAAVGWDGAYRSSDRGKNWIKIIEGNAIHAVNAIALKGNMILAGLQNGFASSTNNGTSWQQDINTFNFDIRSIAKTDPYLMATTNNGIYISNDNGLNWEREGINMKIFETINTVVYIGGENGFNRSDNYGKNLIWQGINGFPEHPQFTDIEASGSVAFASLYNHGIYFSDDIGWNWKARNSGLTSYKLRALTFKDSTVFVASENKGVFRSLDFGMTWSESNSGLQDTSITCLSHYRNIIYAGTSSNGIFKSVDNGDSWIQLQNEFDNAKILCLYNYGVSIFAGVEGKGFYFSPNNGNDWYTYNDRLFNYRINSIVENDSIIYLGTSGGAIWERKLSDLPIKFSVKNIDVNKYNICKGELVELKAHVVGGKPPYNFIWSNGSGTGSIVVSPVKTTTYFLTVTDANQDTATFDITIKVKQKPKTPYIYSIGDTLFSSELIGNFWMFDGEVLSFESGNKLIPYSAGRYSVKVKIEGCLSDESHPFLIEKFKISKFNKGWNIFSIPLQPIPEAMDINFNPLIENNSLAKIQDEDGNSLENWGIFGGWTNGIGDINPGKGYKIKVNKTDSLEFCGSPVEYPYSIPLKSGWNIIGYPQLSTFDGMSNIVQQLIDRGTLLKVQDENGNSIENWGIFGGWTNGIGDFIPGKGYKIKVSAKDTLWIYSDYEKSKTIIHEIVATTHFIPDFEGNGIDHMNINLVSLPVNDLKTGDEFAIFNGTTCVGTTVIMPHHLESKRISIAVSANDKLGMAGFIEGEPITLKLWKSNYNQEFVLVTEILNGAPTFTKHETMVVSLGKYSTTGLEGITGSKITEINCYPNPFGEKINIEIKLSDNAQVQFEIINQLGQFVKSIGTSQMLQSGLHKFEWNGCNASNQAVSNGIYYLRIVVNGQDFHRKIVYSK